MPRVVSLFLPSWSTDLVRKSSATPPPAEAPLILAGREGRRRVALAVDAAAWRAGLRPGAPVTKAQALLPGLTVLDANPEADARALDRLAVWMLQCFAPIVAADPPDGIVMESTGADHLHGGEDVMLSGLIGRLAGSGVTARAAVADTWGEAYALARYVARPTIVARPGGSATALAALPLAALRLPAATVAELRVLGFERIADLEAAPRAPVALRFGPGPGRRLDQAMGRLAEPIECVRSPDVIEVRRVFAEPIAAAETIARYIGKLVAQLCKALEAKALGARQLDLICHRVDDRAEAVRVGTARPARDVKRLTRLLGDKIEAIDPGFGIEAMRLSATLVEPLAAAQTAASLTDEVAPDISDLIDTLANRVGGRRLYRVCAVASDVPERSVCRITPLAPETGAAWPWRWPRPARLLALPEPIETVALLPDHPPVAFTWRGVRRRVSRADGPERIFGEWWRREAEQIAIRDYFQLEDEAGGRYWVFRSGDGEDASTGSQGWFLHGIFG